MLAVTNLSWQEAVVLIFAILAIATIVIWRGR